MDSTAPLPGEVGAVFVEGHLVGTMLDVLQPASCDGCGLCCEGIGSPVLLYAARPGWREFHPYRPDDLPAELAAEIDEHFSGLLRGQEPQERCLWFDPAERVCRHYEFRPQICKDYELGGPSCLLRRESARPGAEPRAELPSVGE